MGNVNARDGANDTEDEGSNAESGMQQEAPNSRHGGRAVSSDCMANDNSPPHSPALSTSPLLFAPQVPVAPLPRADGSPLNPMWHDESHGVDHLPEPGIPTIITWNYGGKNVVVEGSWDNWASRKHLQRSAKDHSVLLVLPSGVYHYKFIVDGEWRYNPDLPSVADEMGHLCNVLDVHDYVPENLDSIGEFAAPPSPDCTYSRAFPVEEDFGKEPLAVPSQLHLTVLDMENSKASDASSKPQHVVLNHLFIEKRWASQSLVALGLTHRFHSKYVTVVLYKPLER